MGSQGAKLSRLPFNDMTVFGTHKGYNPPVPVVNLFNWYNCIWNIQLSPFLQNLPSVKKLEGKKIKEANNQANPVFLFWLLLYCSPSSHFPFTKWEARSWRGWACPMTLRSALGLPFFLGTCCFQHRVARLRWWLSALQLLRTEATSSPAVLTPSTLEGSTVSSDFSIFHAELIIFSTKPACPCKFPVPVSHFMGSQKLFVLLLSLVFCLLNSMCFLIQKPQHIHLGGGGKMWLGFQAVLFQC